MRRALKKSVFAAYSATKAAKKLKGKFGGKGLFKKKKIDASKPDASASPSSQIPALSLQSTQIVPSEMIPHSQGAIQNENMSISIDSSNNRSSI